MNGVSHYGSVVLSNNKIIKFEEKKDSPGESLVNSGVYIFEPKIFSYIEPNENISLEKGVFPKLALEGFLHGYEYDGYFTDLGRPETYRQFKQDVIKNNLLVDPLSTIRSTLEKIMRTGIPLLE